MIQFQEAFGLNFLRLLYLVYSGIPLPFASINNKLSFVGIDNLVDFLICCLDHPAVFGQTLLVSDQQDVSTPELIRILAKSLKVSVRLFPTPVLMLKSGGFITGRFSEIQQITGSMLVDSRFTSELLDWHPTVSVDRGMQKTAEWFLCQK